jgi:hypothetical protein
MKVNANVIVEISGDDLTRMFDDVEETIHLQIRREVEESIKKSNAFRKLKMVIYHACLDAIRKEIAEEFVDKIKGEDNG